MKTVVPIGPYHPILEEPEYFKLIVEGEIVKDMEIHLGGNHRGMEKIAEGMNFIQVMYLVERICGICSMSHPLAYINAVESLANVELPERARYIRAIVAELERLHSHLLWVGLAGHFIGYNTVWMWAWKYREPILDMLEHIGGNRNMYAINRIGGVSRDIEDEDIKQIKKLMKKVKKATKLFHGAIKDDPVIHARLKGIGILTPEDVHNTSALGPTARGSGVATDVRADDPYAGYEEYDWKVITWPSMDIYGRTMVRVLENYEAINIINECCEKLIKCKTKTIVNDVTDIPEGEAVGRAEAPRGETMHYVMSNGTNKPIRHKMRAPTYNNIQTYKTMCKDESITDALLIMASIDPCYSCTERITIVNEKKQEKTLTQNDLIRMSWEKTERIKKEIL